MRGLFRSIWFEPAAPDVPARSWRDRLLVLVLVAVAIVEGTVRHNVPYRAIWLPVVVGMMLTLLWRRSRPLPMITLAFGGSAAATVLLGGAQSNIAVEGAVLLLPYALYRWGSGRAIVLGSVVVVAGPGIGIVAADLRGADAAAGLFVLVSTVALGAAFRYRARAKVRELDQIKLVERERLARDLHDTVAHHVSAIAIRAQAGLATAESTSGAAGDALRLIETEAARTLTEMRSIVRALRRDRPDDDENCFPTPGLADLQRLAGLAGSGPAVAVEIGDGIGDLPATVGTALYRMAQEAVTNAMRHARNATRVEVRIDADETVVRLRVRDDGDPGRAFVTGSPGYGLIGMAERAVLLGGTCEAGPDPGRGWTVTAVLPREGAAR
ncbi:sensor histidine kinase [Nocardia sp. BMG111209]|uniref:sensor histidine kinase n=1 Tax=Nocardia sp. BMG111209 TaxID=1160137 RepID=UPI0003706EE3|nr:sensor histidine kinase [Nocardia sp. BMG111209]